MYNNALSENTEIGVINSMKSARMMTACAVIAAMGMGVSNTRAEADANMDAAQRILALAMNDTRDGTMVRITLKTLRDPALVPLFKRIMSSKSASMRLDAMLAMVIAKKDPALLDIKELFATGDDARIGSAIGQLIESEQISNDQLKAIMDRDGVDPAHRLLAVTELSRRKGLPDHTILLKVLERESGTASRYDVVRHYAAMTLLETENAEENKKALDALMEMLQPRDRRLEQVQELMLYRVFKDKLKLATPWVRAIASDFDATGNKGDSDTPHVSARLSMTAMATLLALNDPEGPKVMEQLITIRREIADQLTLGLTAIEFADRVPETTIAKLGAGRTSQLIKAVTDAAKVALKNKGTGKEVDAAVMSLVQDGQPIVLNWALGYAATSPKERQITLRVALINQSSILDDARGTEYERAAIAANRLIEENGEEGRAQIAAILKGNNRGATEAALLGMLRASNAKNLSEMILPNYQAWCQSPATEYAANYATLILAREGKQEAVKWLGGMLNGGSVQNIGFRAIAAWQYAKLKDQTGPVLDRLIADADAATKPK